MGATKVNKQSGEHNGPRVGTWIGVSIVGGVILATYGLLFGLFMARF